MNYLAHAYLSFGDPDILTGNLISDFVKGKKKFDYPVRIQAGISLHRSIDAFTDSHPSTKAAAVWLRPAAGAYAGAFLDVAYDHFLANDPEIFADDSLAAFASGIYAQMRTRSDWFPPVSARFFASMEKHDWLLNYRTKEGIRRSFEGLVYRARYIDDAAPVFDLFLRHEEMLRNHYDLFIPQLRAFAYHEFLYLR